MGLGGEPLIPGALSTERLSLVPASWRDAGFLWQMMTDGDVRRYLGGVRPVAERMRSLPRYWRVGAGEASWVVREKERGSPLGLVMLTDHHDGVGQEISFVFATRAHGNGYGREAVGAVLSSLTGQDILAETQAANAPARRLLEAVGMIEDKPVERFGVDQVIYRLPR